MAKKNKNSDSQYDGVYKFRKSKHNMWSAKKTAPDGKKINAIFDTELEAARAIDYFCANNNIDPPNGILVFKGIRTL